jgi:hypothetical protein
LGRLTVALNDELKWPIEPPLADEIAKSLYTGRHENAYRLMVTTDEFRNAARTALSDRPSEEVAALLGKFAPEEESTMVMLTWSR